MQRGTMSRGAMLRDGAERRAMMERARSEEANECTQCRLVIGQCSCAGGPRTPVAMAVAPIGAGRVQVVAPGGAVNAYEPGDAGGWVVVPPVASGAYPKSICDSYGQPVGWNRAMREVMAMGKQEPYVDPLYDWANMDTLYSDLITVGPGATVNIDVSPEVGTFAAFYYNVVAVDPATQVQQVDWRITRPSVTGCPVPCANPGPILAQFVQRVPEGCCGVPLSAFLDQRSNNVPLRSPFTNNQAAGDLLVQFEVRGYCCSTRIC